MRGIADEELSVQGRSVIPCMQHCELIPLNVASLYVHSTLSCMFWHKVRQGNEETRSLP